MHFSIPDLQQFYDDNGTSYTVLILQIFYSFCLCLLNNVSWNLQTLMEKIPN